MKKTPRELLLEKYAGLGTKLDGVREAALAACESRAVENTDREENFFQRLVTELLWKPRRAWAAITAGWAVAITFQFLGAADPMMEKRPESAAPEMLTLVRETREHWSDLTEIFPTPAVVAEEPKRSRPHGCLTLTPTRNV